MNLTLYWAPGACSFIPHVALELAEQPFDAKMLKLHKGEQKTPAYLAINPNGQVPTLVVDGRPLTQIVAITEFLARSFPAAQILPADGWARTEAMSRLAWFNNTVHTTFSHFFAPAAFATSEAAQADVKAAGQARYLELMRRIERELPVDAFFGGARPNAIDAYVLTFFRWSGLAGIDPATLPQLHAHVERAAADPAVARAMGREQIHLRTYRPH